MSPLDSICNILAVDVCVCGGKGVLDVNLG